MTSYSALVEAYRQRLGMNVGPRPARVGSMSLDLGGAGAPDSLSGSPGGAPLGGPRARSLELHGPPVLAPPVRQNRLP